MQTTDASGMPGGTSRSSRTASAVSFRTIGLPGLLFLLLLAAAFTASSASAATAVMGPTPKGFSTSARVTGNIGSVAGDPAGTTYWRFDISTNGTDWNSAEWSTADPNPVSAAQEIHANLINLAPETKYFVRFAVYDAVSNEETISAGPNPEFTTTGPVTPTPPVVVATNNATEVAYTTAKVSGEVERAANEDPLFDASCSFQYITDAQFTQNESNSQPAFEGAGQVGCEPSSTITTPGKAKVTASLSGLNVATIYHLRIVASNSAGSSSKDAAGTFTTLTATPPTVLSVQNATSVAFNTATVEGEIERPLNPDHAFDTYCQFEYITDGAFQPRSEVQQLTVTASGGTYRLSFGGDTTTPIPYKSSAATVQAALTGLAAIGPGNVTVSGGPGNASGSNPYTVTFVGALGSKNVTQVEADGGGLTIPGESSAGVITTSEGHAEGFEGASPVPCDPPNPLEVGGKAKAVIHLTGLTVGTTFHVRLVAYNLAGSDAKTATETFTTQTPALPSVSLTGISGVTASSAHFAGSVNPNGTDPSSYVEWHFKCEPACTTSDQSGNPIIAPDHLDHPVSSDASGLEPNTNYKAILYAINQAGTVESNPVPFTTGFAETSVQTLYANELKSDSATLGGKVGPHNSATTWQFEWGLDKSYGHADPATPAPLGVVDNFFHPVSQAITGLEAETVYHFRLAATNTDTGVTQHGVDHTFRTPPAASCPNEAQRAENGSLALPDCRAYELVSPIEKSGNDAGGTSSPGYGHSSADGNGVLFYGRGPMGEATRGVQWFSIARRGSDGWTTVPAMPKPEPEKFNAISGIPYGPMVSQNLSKIAWGAPGSWVLANPVTVLYSGGYYIGNVGEIDNPAGSVKWLSQPQIPNPEPAPGEIGEPPMSVGAAEDLSTVYFFGRPTILPGDSARVASGGWGVYEYSNGEVKSAGTLPNGEEPAGGSAPPNTSNPRFLYNMTTEVNRGETSRDGSTLFFLSPDPGVGVPQLYVRRDGHSTLVSHDESGKEAPSGISFGQNGFYGEISQGVFGSPDGNIAIFQSTSALTSDAPENESVKDYRYEVKTNTVTYLPGLDGAVVSASSDDGSRFLFAQGRIGLWDEGQVTTISPTFGGRLLTARSTASGSVFVFQASVVPGFNSGTSQEIEQVYRYDVDQEQLTCVSCPPDAIFPSGGTGVGPLGIGVVPNPIMSEDGERIFFDSPDPLVPQDTNNQEDVYEWTQSGPSLITSGAAETGAYVTSSSANGDDVFFTTKQGIDPNDDDGVYDVYDARVDGGFRRRATVAPCGGVAGCHGAPQEPPAPIGPGTNAFSGKSTPKFRLGSGKVVDGKLTVRVTAPEPGTITASGKGLRTARRTYTKAGTFPVQLPLKPSAKSAMHSKHGLKLRVHVRFSPAAGNPSAANLVLTVGG